MELQALKLVVTDADANQLLAEAAANGLEARSLRVHFTTEGVQVTGETSALLFKVSFETLWELTLHDGRVGAKLKSMKVAGVPAGKLRAVLLKVLRDAVAGRPGIAVEDEAVTVDVNTMLSAQRLPLRVGLTAVRCGEGNVVIEA